LELKIHSQALEGQLAIIPLATKGMAMAWTTPVLTEICIGLEINGYLLAEF
jgi:coenzyme PQQ precursor peptide PqqA